MTAPTRQFVRAMPVLECTGLGASVAFYRDKLGFSASTWGRPYGCREFVVDDPDGHIIAFGQVLAPDPLGPGLSDRIGRDEHGRTS